MKGLTERQKDVFFFIAWYISEYSYSPAVRDVAGHFRITAKAAYDHITALKKKGFLRQTPGCPRTIELLRGYAESAADAEASAVAFAAPSTSGAVASAEGDFVMVPMLGNVAAGLPLLAQENFDGSIPVHKSMLKKSQSYFALKVKGDSMSGAGIMDGDIAVIEKRSVANNGEIVVAVIDDAVTLKRFYMESSGVRLEAENLHYKSIYCRDLRLLGRLSCLIRHY
ncbi:MAG: transcriptional repressor LexA [Spirochaetes bacterium]|nr:transcriptional repressor LexA [Spirochaetota bacterium]